MQSVLNLVWDKLLPAMHPSPVPPDDAARQKLEDMLKRLTLRVSEGAGSPAKGLGKTYVFPNSQVPSGRLDLKGTPRKLEAITVEGDGKNAPVTIVARFDSVDARIVCGRTAKLCFYETPFVVTVRLTFSGDELQCNSEANVGFGPTKQPELVGRVR